MPRPLLALLGIAALGGLVFLAWPRQSMPTSGAAPAETGSRDPQLSEGGLGGETERSGANASSAPLGPIDGGVTLVAPSGHPVPEELAETEAAARAILAERQLEHLRATAERAEEGANPDLARQMRARIEALEEARRAAAAATLE